MSFFIGVPTRGSCCAIDNTAMLAEVSEIISSVRNVLSEFPGVAIGDNSMAKKEAAKVQDSKAVELPTAKELMKQIAQQEAEKASEYMRHQSAAEREKKALMERLGKASGLSGEEALRRGRAINNLERG